MVNKLIKNLKIKFFWLTLERFPNLFRPSSKPFISGDSLRKYSDHIFDETSTFNLNKVKQNDVIFISTNMVEIFFKYFDPKIKAKYILISHNSDKNINQLEADFISDNVIHWFCQNLNIEESNKISFIPIGLENLRRLKHGRKKWFKNKKNDKKNYILFSFNKYTNFKKRSNLQNQLSYLDFVKIKNFDKTKNYFKEIKNFKFVLSPQGNGLDTHRIWESLLLDCIPVMIENNFTHNLKKNKIPGLYLHNWSELDSYNEEKLDNEYERIINNNLQKYVMLDYWIKQIESKKI